MLSPTLSVSATEASSTLPATSVPSTRRRGLSYLRSLSSHGPSSTNTSDQPRISPRSFFQRSSSYNDAKNKATTRRRSVSKPDEPTSPIANASTDRALLTRFTSADNPATAGEESTSGGEEIRSSRPRQRPEENNEEDHDDMARHARTEGARRTADSLTLEDGAILRPASARSASANEASGSEEQKQPPPTIRLFPHQDLRNGRQSLHFSMISRTLPSEESVIRVGRYSEREGLPVANPPNPSDAPVGFKSKVVSRKHCEFSFKNGEWHIRDVASSSGTFLNHIRLSQPNQESKPFPIKDGDIVQLGIDFRGGEEMIFKCVKIRIECNRLWQKKPNTFNKQRRAQLLGLTKDQPAANKNSGECSICLGSVLPYQALFVAPCAHVWHYKCIRPLLEGKSSLYPQFQCPNCRDYADLEADVDIAEEDMNDWLENGGDDDEAHGIDQMDRPEGGNVDDSQAMPGPSNEPNVEATINGASPTMSGSGLLQRRTGNTVVTTPDGPPVNTISMPARPEQDEMQHDLEQQRTNTESPNADQIIAGEGPLTPRNNAGPFVFDGSGGSGRSLAIPGLAEVPERRAI